ncbi:hypothetical protein LXL04_034191 [Taraxacum kok-saghyz]
MLKGLRHLLTSCEIAMLWKQVVEALSMLLQRCIIPECQFDAPKLMSGLVEATVTYSILLHRVLNNHNYNKNNFW